MKRKLILHFSRWSTNKLIIELNNNLINEVSHENYSLKSQVINDILKQRIPNSEDFSQLCDMVLGGQYENVSLQLCVEAVNNIVHHS